MSTTVETEHGPLHVKCNNKPRPLVMWHDLPESERATFDYVPDSEHEVFRFFEYRGSWYDDHEFEGAPDSFRALGFDGIQTESYFSAVVLRYYDKDGYAYDDEVVVGYIHW